MKKYRAFTLVELLVVISIISLLMAILMPALSKVRKQAFNAVCKTHLRQWSDLLMLYTNDNDNLVWFEYHVPYSVKGTWMVVLSDLYNDNEEMRVCPSTKLDEVKSQSFVYGTTFKTWGPGHSLFRPEDYGSYGINHWITQLHRGDPGWRNHPQWNWKIASPKGAGRIPMFFDCTWYGTMPYEYNYADSGAGITSGAPPTSQDWSEQLPANFGEYDMTRVCINRHQRAINIAFMDGSVQKTDLRDLWTLKWHKAYNTASGPKPNEFPQWLQAL